jgi:hypothetical protein
MAYLPLLGPVVGLNLWTFAMEGVMYYYRVGYIQSAKLPIDNRLTKAQFDSSMPPEVRWKAENYNHLFEQPTQFYAVVITQALLLGSLPGKTAKVDLRLAWAYVALRLVHSAIHCIHNKIWYRFQMYIVLSGILATLTVRTGLNMLEVI